MWRRCDKHRPVEEIRCDRCGREFDWMPYLADDGYDGYWVDPSDDEVEFQAEEEGWTVGSTETLCPECIDEMENEE